MSTAQRTIGYSRIVERRPKAVLIDMGEGQPAWFPLSKIRIDEEAYTLTAPGAMIDEKLAGSGGAPMKRDPKQDARVTLPPPAWEGEKSIGIDVVISGLDGRGKVRERLFFPKSQMEGRTAPRWLVEKKQNEALDSVAAQNRWRREDLMLEPFRDRSLLGKTAASDAEPEAPAHDDAPAPELKTVGGAP